MRFQPWVDTALLYYLNDVDSNSDIISGMLPVHAIVEAYVYISCTHSQKRIMKAFAFTKPHDFRVFTKEYS